jgi:hypothetical protein
VEPPFAHVEPTFRDPTSAKSNLCT